MTIDRTGAGHSLTSFRAETYGFASLVFFLSLLHSVHPLPTLLLSTHLDSESLITRITNHLSSSYTTPSQAMSCDQDILLFIYHHLSIILIHIQLHHVKSHQDCHAPIHSLSLPAQANIAADQLATIALHTHPSCSLIPLHYTTVCHFNVHGVTITSAFAANT